MLRKSLKFMAVIIVTIMAWGLWVNLSVRYDEHKEQIRLATENALTEHEEAIEKAVDMEREQKKVIEYHVNGTGEETKTYPYKMYSDVYVYYTTNPDDDRANCVDIIRVFTYYGNEQVFSSRVEYFIE